MLKDSSNENFLPPTSYVTSHNKKKAILKNKDGVFTYKRTNSSLNIFRMIARLQFCKCHHYLFV